MKSGSTKVVVAALGGNALIALIGLTIALVGVGLAEITGLAFFDGLSSICIGLLLAAVAFLLARKTKGLLIGEAVPQVLAIFVESRALGPGAKP